MGTPSNSKCVMVWCSGVEKTFDIDAGDTAFGGSHTGLAVVGVADVASGEDAGNAGGTGGVLDFDIASLVEFELSVEERRIGLMTDGDKETGDIDAFHFACFYIFEFGTHNAIHIGSDDLLCDAVPKHLDFGVGEHAVLHGFGSAELVAADNHVDFVAESGQIGGLFAGGVAAANHCDVEVLVEEAVAGGTGRDALTVELLFAFKTQPAGRCTSGDNDGFGLDLFAFVVNGDERTVGKVDFFDSALTHLGAETEGLLAKVLHHSGAGDAFGIAGEILNFGGDGQLSAGLEAFVQKGFQVGATGIDARGIASRA